jgi:hypothetical protein
MASTAKARGSGTGVTKVSNLWFRLVAKRSTWGRSHRRTTESNTTCSSSHSVLTGLWKRDRQSASTLKVPGICLTTRWMCDRRQRRRISLQRRKRAWQRVTPWFCKYAITVVLSVASTTAFETRRVLKCCNSNKTALISSKLMCSCCWTRDHTPDTDFSSRKAPHPWRLESVYRVREGTGWSKATPVKTFPCESTNLGEAVRQEE